MLKKERVLMQNRTAMGQIPRSIERISSLFIYYYTNTHNDDNLKLKNSESAQSSYIFCV